MAGDRDHAREGVQHHEETLGRGEKFRIADFGVKTARVSGTLESDQNYT
jgi:hypothetical protein